MKRFLILSLAIIALACRSPIAFGQSSCPIPGFSPTNGRTFVVTVDGAGQAWTLAANLQTVYEEKEMPAWQRPVIRPILWGSDDNLDAYRNKEYHVVGAARLVYEVQGIRRIAPASPIILIGYSAGASVVVLAANQLPPCSVDRIILLGPTVSSRYDIRPALRASKLGVDLFYNTEDTFLAYVERRWGAPYEDPGSTTAATTGFLMANPRSALACDPLFGKLRQHDLTGRARSHFNTADYPFLTRYIMPMIAYSQ